MDRGGLVIPSGGRFVKCPRVQRSKETADSGWTGDGSGDLLRPDRIFLPLGLI